MPLSELVQAVTKHLLEGIVAQRIGSQYWLGERCGDWVKWGTNRGQELVIGGYIPNGDPEDSILLGYYKKRELIYAGGVRADLPSQYRRVLLPQFEALRKQQCPSSN